MFCSFPTVWILWLVWGQLTTDVPATARFEELVEARNTWSHMNRIVTSVRNRKTGTSVSALSVTDAKVTLQAWTVTAIPMLMLTDPTKADKTEDVMRLLVIAGSFSSGQRCKKTINLYILFREVQRRAAQTLHLRSVASFHSKCLSAEMQLWWVDLDKDTRRSQRFDQRALIRI